MLRLTHFNLIIDFSLDQVCFQHLAKSCFQKDLQFILWYFASNIIDFWKTKTSQIFFFWKSLAANNKLMRNSSYLSTVKKNIGNSKFVVDIKRKMHFLRRLVWESIMNISGSVLWIANFVSDCNCYSDQGHNFVQQIFQAT